MCLKPTCSTCNKTVSHRNSMVCAQYFKTIHLKCKNFVDSQLIKNSNNSWFCSYCSNYIFLLLTLLIKKCNQSSATRNIVLMTI